MILIRSVLFDRAERELLQAAQTVIEVAYPRASNPLTPRGVAEDDPHLKVLRTLATNANDPVPYARLVLAQETLQALSAAVREQADPAYWAGQITGRDLSKTELSMSEALVQARTQSVGMVTEALQVINQALEPLSVRDDPKWLRDNVDDNYYGTV